MQDQVSGIKLKIHGKHKIWAASQGLSHNAAAWQIKLFWNEVTRSFELCDLPLFGAQSDCTESPNLLHVKQRTCTLFLH